MQWYASAAERKGILRKASSRNGHMITAYTIIIQQFIFCGPFCLDQPRIRSIFTAGRTLQVSAISSRGSVTCFSRRCYAYPDWIRCLCARNHHILRCGARSRCVQACRVCRDAFVFVVYYSSYAHYNEKRFLQSVWAFLSSKTDAANRKVEKLDHVKFQMSQAGRG